MLFNTAFTEGALANFLDRVTEIEESSETEIAILINSPGGSIAVLQTMVDWIQHTELHVTTIASGLAASCGTMLLMAGDYRMAFPSAAIMSHMYSSGARGKHSDLVASRVMQDQTHKFMMDFYKLHTGLPEAVITKELLPAEDVWLTAAQAVYFNIIDSIVDPLGKPIGFKSRKRATMEYRKNELHNAQQIIQRHETQKGN